MYESAVEMVIVNLITLALSVLFPIMMFIFMHSLHHRLYKTPVGINLLEKKR